MLIFIGIPHNRTDYLKVSVSDLGLLLKFRWYSPFFFLKVAYSYHQSCGIHVYIHVYNDHIYHRLTENGVEENIPECFLWGVRKLESSLLLLVDLVMLRK